MVAWADGLTSHPRRCFRAPQHTAGKRIGEGGRAFAENRLAVGVVPAEWAGVWGCIRWVSCAAVGCSCACKSRSSSQRPGAARGSAPRALLGLVQDLVRRLDLLELLLGFLEPVPVLVCATAASPKKGKREHGGEQPGLSAASTGKALGYVEVAELPRAGRHAEALQRRRPPGCQIKASFLYALRISSSVALRSTPRTS